MTTISEPPVFPRLAQDAKPEQVEVMVLWLTHQTLDDLRMRQGIHEQQIDLANAQGKNTIALSELWKLDMTTDAVSRQQFGEPMAGAHTRR